MNLFFTTAVFLTTLFSFLSPEPDDEVIEKIAVVIRAGNAKELSKFFNESIDLNIPGNEGVYSHTQAELIMRDFFSANTPVSFSILHKGTSKDGAMYSIGTLTTQKNAFRTYILLRKKSNEFLIHEINLSKQEEK